MFKCKHKKWQPYEWRNYLDNTNTNGNYIKIIGGKYISYICMDCKIIKTIDDNKVN